MALNYSNSWIPGLGRFIIGSNEAPTGTIVVNSAVVQVGDILEWSAGFIQRQAAGTTGIAGILTGVGVGSNANADPDSATLDTWTVSSDNQTVLKEYAQMDVSPYSIYSAAMSGTLGTTAGSDLAGAYFDGASSNSHNNLLETHNSVVSGQFFSWGVDPADSTRTLVNINELAYIQNSG